MNTLVRRVVVCGSCGGHITLYDINCPYCNNALEPIGDTRHILPHTTDNPHATEDALSIKPHLDQICDFVDFYPDQLDDLAATVTPLKDHKYPFREYIIDLLCLISGYKNTRLKTSDMARSMYLEMYKRLDAIYNSLTGTSVY